MQSASPSKPETTTLHRLLQEKGLSQYGVFFSTGEGRTMPNGEEEATGFVIDHGGHIFAWWMRWDHEKNEPAFIEWEIIREQSHWLKSSEYLEARLRAGLENS